MPEHVELKKFQKLGEYELPALPTKDALQLLYSRLKKRFSQSDDQPYIADDRLRRTTESLLEDVVPMPTWGALVDELDLTLKDWIEEEEPALKLKLIVLPPGDSKGLLASWAKERNFPVWEPPERSSFLHQVSAEEEQARSLDERFPGGEVIVVPALERWFLRHADGLDTMRELLQILDSSHRRIVVGCNSWAWLFLKKAVNADMFFPDALTFQAYDAARLRNWFGELDGTKDEEKIVFRLGSNGEDVMKVADEDDSHDYFHGLAARSFGIPWVAWHLWRRSLRRGAAVEEANGDAAENASENVSSSGEDNDDDEVSRKKLEAAADDDRTLWVTALEEYVLPNGESDQVLHVLQAVLIHGAMTLEELDAVLPSAVDPAVMSALRNSGLLRRVGVQFECVPDAYPAIRSGLSAAGFPTDRL